MLWAIHSRLTILTVVLQYRLDIHRFRLSNRIPFLCIFDLQRRSQVCSSELEVEFELRVSYYDLVFAEYGIRKLGLERLLQSWLVGVWSVEIQAESLVRVC